MPALVLANSFGSGACWVQGDFSFSDNSSTTNVSLSVYVENAKQGEVLLSEEGDFSFNSLKGFEDDIVRFEVCGYTNSSDIEMQFPFEPFCSSGDGMPWVEKNLVLNSSVCDEPEIEQSQEESSSSSSRGSRRRAPVQDFPEVDESSKGNQVLRGRLVPSGEPFERSEVVTRSNSFLGSGSGIEPSFGISSLFPDELVPVGFSYAVSLYDVEYDDGAVSEFTTIKKRVRNPFAGRTDNVYLVESIPANVIASASSLRGDFEVYRDNPVLYFDVSDQSDNLLIDISYHYDAELTSFNDTSTYLIYGDEVEVVDEVDNAEDEGIMDTVNVSDTENVSSSEDNSSSEESDVYDLLNETLEKPNLEDVNVSDLNITDNVVEPNQGFSVFSYFVLLLVVIVAMAIYAVSIIRKKKSKK